MHHRLRPAIAAAALALTALPMRGARAQVGDSAGPPDTAGVTQLEGITVVGARTTAAAPAVPTVDVPPERLLRSPAADPYDLVRRAAGIEVHQQGQGPGFASDAVIRGFTSDHSSDVLLVVDGVPINLPLHGHVEGYSDWSLLSPAGVSALRVIPGPASPLYGDFAVGGVVEVTTAADAAGSSGAVGGSSYGDVDARLTTGRSAAHGGSLVALDGRREQGWRDNAGYWLGNGVVRGWRGAGAGRLEGGLRVYGSSWNSPGFVSVSRYNDGALQAAADPTDGGSAGRLIVHGRYARPLGGAVLDATAWGQAARSDVFLGIPEDGELSQTDEQDRRAAVGARAQVTWPATVTGELSAGVDGRADRIRYRLYQSQARVRGEPEQDDDGRFWSAGAFVRWRDLLGQRLVYDVGGRLDLLDYASRDRLGAAADWRRGSPVVASPKLGVRYLLGSRVALLGSLSRGFRGSVGVIQDPSRPPVLAWSKEVGAEYDDGRVHAQVALFHVAVSRERIQDPVTRDISDAGTSARRGISVDASIGLGAATRVIAEATLNDAKITGVAGSATPAEVVTGLTALSVRPIRPNFHDVPLTPGATVPGVARYFGRAGIETAAAPWARVRGLFRFTGPYTPIGEPAVRTRSYGLLDLGASLRVPAVGGIVDLDLLNVLDTRYPELRASGFVNPGAPRMLRAAVRFGEPG